MKNTLKNKNYMVKYTFTNVPAAKQNLNEGIQKNQLLLVQHAVTNTQMENTTPTSITDSKKPESTNEQHTGDTQYDNLPIR